MFDRRTLNSLYRRLYRAYGPQSWWPAETPFEIMVGTVLTQNTNWKNVEHAIANLKRAGVLTPEAILGLRGSRLPRLIRPSGYFNVKSRRLTSLCRWLVEQGGLLALAPRATGELRGSLLAVNGVGPETADSILLYALDRPVFVIDTYTRRLLSRLELARGDEHYETLRAGFESALRGDAPLYNEYHALIVRHAKERCSRAAGCRHCRVETISGGRR